MRYLVKARVKPGFEGSLLQAIETETLGKGSVAGEEYLQNMKQARAGKDESVHWVETCFCDTPLNEERPYWEKYFELLSIKDAHSRRNCKHENGTDPWACCECDCTRRLEDKLASVGSDFLAELKRKVTGEESQ